jgi:hypothetical protein
LHNYYLSPFTRKSFVSFLETLEKLVKFVHTYRIQGFNPFWYSIGESAMKLSALIILAQLVINAVYAKIWSSSHECSWMITFCLEKIICEVLNGTFCAKTWMKFQPQFWHLLCFSRWISSHTLELSQFPMT